VAHKLSWFSTDHVGVLLPKIKKIPQNTNGRLAIPAPAGLLVLYVAGDMQRRSFTFDRTRFFSIYLFAVLVR